jgi:parallel beta-helix repeat protein
VRKGIRLSAISFFILLLSAVFYFQPATAQNNTKFISDDATGGDCTSIGNWEPATKTCTLTTDVNEPIQIVSNGITLDGDDHTITGTGAPPPTWPYFCQQGIGVCVYQRNAVTVKNLRVTNFGSGIFLLYSTNVNVADNRIFGTSHNGIWNAFSNSNNIKDNVVSDTYIGIIIEGSSGSIIQDNTISDVGLIGIYTTFYQPSIGDSIVGNKVSNSNLWGILMSSSQNNILRDNEVSDSVIGIQVGLTGQCCTSANNLVEDNEVSSSGTNGIVIQSSNSNSILDNDVSDSGANGISVLSSSSNNHVIDNEVENSGSFDLFWDVTGTGNCWKDNDYATSSPASLPSC